MSADARTQLVELLGDNPELVAEIRDLFEANEGAPGSAEPMAHTFIGVSTEAPTHTQTRKSLKYEVSAPIPEGDEDGPKALVIAYLPPEVATESIEVIVSAEGVVTQGRQITGRRRKKAS